MNLKNILFIGLSIIIINLNVNLVNGQDYRKEDLLDSKISRFEYSGSSLSELLQKLASYHGIPVGVDNIGNREEKCRLNERMELTETDGTLRDLLNRITEKSTNCKFEVVDEVLNVYSSNGWSFIADQKLARIKIEHGNGKNEIKSKIIKDKNLQSLLKRENKRLTFFVTSLGDYRPVSKDFSFQGEGLSVREILNKIIKSGSSRYWVLTTVDDQNDTVYLNF